MDFINSQVDLGGLPKAEELALHPVQAAYKKVLRVEWAVSSVILLVVAALVIIFTSSIRNSLGWLIIAAAVVCICAMHFIFIQLSFPFLSYAVREKDVVFQKGWLVRSIKICPFNRIQNCSVQSGPLERKFGLASLIIFTAGTNGADMRIPGLLQEEADRLRYFILGKIHIAPDETV